MKFKEDITTRIMIDFRENSNKAMTILTGAITDVDAFKNDRLIRCVLFLAKRNLNELVRYTESAAIDPRDVMLWAEYEENNGDLNYKRVRDFNEPFKRIE